MNAQENTILKLMKENRELQASVDAAHFLLGTIRALYPDLPIWEQVSDFKSVSDTFSVTFRRIP